MIRRKVFIISFSFLFLTAGSSWSGWNKDGSQETISDKELKEWFQNRLKGAQIAKDRDLIASIERQIREFDDLLERALGATQRAGGTNSNTPAGPEEADSSSIASILRKAKKQEPPAVPSPVPVEVDSDQEREDWRRIYGHAQAHASNSRIIEPLANYFWQVYRKGGGGDGDIQSHSAYLIAQLNKEPGKAGLPKYTIGRMPEGPPGAIVLATYEPGRDVVTFRDGMQNSLLVTSHETIHATEWRVHGDMGQSSKRQIVMAALARVLPWNGGDMRDAPASNTYAATTLEEPKGPGNTRQGSTQGYGQEVHPSLRPMVTSLAAEELAYTGMGSDCGKGGGHSILPMAVAQIEQQFASQVKF